MAAKLQHFVVQLLLQLRIVAPSASAVPTIFDGGLAAVLEQPADFAQRLLHPFDPSVFFEDVFGRRPHHFARHDFGLEQHNADLVPTDSPVTMQRFLRHCVSAAVPQGRQKHDATALSVIF